uniref:Thioredoxin domain-containing protein 17 n=1 Tax=Panagrolaimus sp. JU765 TaxID=591449 RepID=A0AC34REA5_9BILA
MLIQKEVEGFDALQNALINLDQKNPIIIYFCGDRIDGKSWCPDCVQSDEHINSILKDINDGKLQPSSPRTLLTVLVGTREPWKNKENKFRTVLNVNSIPTFRVYGKENEQIDDDKVTYDNIKKFLVDPLN